MVRTRLRRELLGARQLGQVAVEQLRPLLELGQRVSAEDRDRVTTERVRVVDHGRGLEAFRRQVGVEESVDERRERLASDCQTLTLDVDVSAVYRAVRLGQLPAVRLTNRGAIRIPTSAIDPEFQER